MRPLAPALVALIALVASFNQARAEADEWGVSLGPSVLGVSESLPNAQADAQPDTQALRLFWGLEGRLRYGLDDFWQVGGSLDLGVASPHAAIGATALAEVHYVIDIVTWVPYVSFGFGMALRTSVPKAQAGAGAETALDLVLAFGGGLEYRPDRDYALGLSGRYMLVPTDLDRTDLAFQTGLNLTLFFE